MASTIEAFTGEIRIFAGTFAPEGWAFCDGRLLAVAQYNALFSLVGTKYGGDGRITFGLPDLRGRVPVGVGHGISLTPRYLGNRGGYEEVRLTPGQLPSHTHTATSIVETNVSATGTLKATDGGAESNSPLDASLTTLSPTKKIYKKGDANIRMKEGNVDVDISADSFKVTTNIEKTGGQLPHYNMQPFMCLHYIICLDGVYPPRPSSEQ